MLSNFLKFQVLFPGLIGSKNSETHVFKKYAVKTYFWDLAFFLTEGFSSSTPIFNFSKIMWVILKKKSKIQLLM